MLSYILNSDINDKWKNNHFLYFHLNFTTIHFYSILHPHLHHLRHISINLDLYYISCVAPSHYQLQSFELQDLINANKQRIWWNEKVLKLRSSFGLENGKVRGFCCSTILFFWKHYIKSIWIYYDVTLLTNHIKYLKLQNKNSKFIYFEHQVCLLALYINYLWSNFHHYLERQPSHLSTQPT